MKTRLFCGGLMLVLAAAIGNVAAEEIEIDWTYSGAQIDSVVDVNLDGTTANEFHVWMKGGPGKASGNGLFELRILGATDDCPSPLVGTEFLYSTYVARFENGDLLFVRATSADLGCIDPITRISSGVVHYDVVGGTGKYRGATGSFDDHSTFVFLLSGPDPLNPAPFAALFGHAEGYLYTVDD